MNKKLSRRDISKAIEQVKVSGFWFVDIPRTSSSSIRVELGQHFGYPYGKENLLDPSLAVANPFSDHITANAMRKAMGPSIWKRLYTFSIVRNPWDRVFSMYHYRKLRQNIPSNWSFSDYVLELEKAVSRQNEYFRYQGFRAGCADYLFDDSRERLLVTDVIKYEAREGGLRPVRERLGMPALGIACLQRATPPARDYVAYYDDRTRKIIQKLYQDDIELFEYGFERKPVSPR